MQRLLKIWFLSGLLAVLMGCPVPDPSLDGIEGNSSGECDDAADNDSDGLWDCDDPDCAGAPNCSGDDDDATGDDDDTTGDDDDATGDDDDATGDDDDATGDDDDATGDDDDATGDDDDATGDDDDSGPAQTAVMLFGDLGPGCTMSASVDVLSMASNVGSLSVSGDEDGVRPDGMALDVGPWYSVDGSRNTNCGGGGPLVVNPSGTLDADSYLAVALSFGGPAGGQIPASSGIQVAGVDYEVDQAWVGFAAGTAPAWAEQLITNNGGTVVVQTFVDPPGYIVEVPVGVSPPLFSITMLGEFEVEFAAPIPL